MAQGIIGVVANAPTARESVALIQDYERRGIAAAWLTTGSPRPDGLTTLAAAAVTTERILLGSSITPTWPRHPVALVQQALSIHQLAPGRLRVGVGPSHGSGMQSIYGAEFRKPLTHLREYLTIARTLLTEGAVDFTGEFIRSRSRLEAGPAPVPIMAAALRERSYEVCGEAADGAISWVTPGNFLLESALPAVQRGAASAGRAAPPLVAHLPVCVHDDASQVLEAAREQLAAYPRLPFYQAMFAASGFPEAGQTQTWSQGMTDATVASGDEETVAGRIRELFEGGVAEVICTVMPAGANPAASRERTLNLLASL
jgi:F420-dependent oxidoreductase-like protein